MRKKSVLTGKGWSPGAVNRARWLHPWKPKASLGDPMNESVLGLSILSALSVAGLWSAVNPSYFTFRSFAAKPEAREVAKEGIWIGLGISTLASLGIGLVFEEWIAAAVSEATALTLFGISLYAINRPPVDSIPAIQNQETTFAPQGQPVPTQI